MTSCLKWRGDVPSVAATRVRAAPLKEGWLREMPERKIMKGLIR